MKSGADAAKITEEALREAALRYLDRQDGSVEQVRRSLRRRIYRYGDEASQPAATEAVERVLLGLQEAHLLDDARFSLAFSQSQRRRGASTLYLLQKLKTRGLSHENIESALQAIKQDDEYSEEASCAIYARKRRLTERYDLADPLQRNKALAALARRGFSFDIARRVLKL